MVTIDLKKVFRKMREKEKEKKDISDFVISLLLFTIYCNTERVTSSRDDILRLLHSIRRG